GREIGVLSWAGTRGVISLAAIFTLPLTVDNGQPFPGRDLLLFCTYLVVVVTLVGQGLTFAPIAHALGVHADPADAALVRTPARPSAPWCAPGPGRRRSRRACPGWTRSPRTTPCPGRCYPRCGPAWTLRPGGTVRYWTGWRPPRIRRLPDRAARITRPRCRPG